MQASARHQIFSLGVLVGQHETEVPLETSVQIEGRGVFATVRLTFQLGADMTSEDRVFCLQTPWDAVLCELSCDAASLDVASGQTEPSRLASTQTQTLETLLGEVPGELLLVHLPAGEKVSTIAVEFLVALDLLWHRGGLAFLARGGRQRVSLAGRWDLTGLVGAGIAFSQAAQPCRLETLEGARYRWSEPLELGPEEEARLDFSLDEKKAASVAVFCPSVEDDSRGAAAVAVIAPVRAQLPREPIRLALLVEARNPQEILLLRELVEGVSEILRTGDELSLWLVGTDSPRSLVAWTSVESVTDEILAQLLEPSVIGRAPDLWDNLSEILASVRGATHFVLATSGNKKMAPSSLFGQLPAFIFATGRKPHRGPLEGIAQRTGGVFCTGLTEGVEVFVERLKVRLSPPLLSDFKLDGWGLDELLPAGSVQVYSDQPALVMGRHSGLLPKTVTLSGLSPARQKLAQRVRVETLPELDLAPLYRDRLARWEGQAELHHRWAGGGVSACRLSHPGELRSHFVEAEESWDTSASDSMSIDLFGAPSLDVGSGEASESLGGPDFPSSFDTFEGPPPSLADTESDLFDSDSFFSGPAPGQPMVIFQGGSATDDGDEPDLFEDPTELTSAAPEPQEEAPFEVPSGPPMIVPSFTEESDEGEGEASQPMPSGEESTDSAADEDDRSDKRRLLSWRQRSDEGVSVSLGAGPQASDTDPQPEVQTGQQPEWLEKFQSLEPERARTWLESCSIDWLGLAASLMDPTTSEELLSQLSPLRQRAVRIQMEWGFLLETYEREQADRQLSLALTQELISH